MLSRKLTRSIAAGVVVIAIGGGTYGRQANAGDVERMWPHSAPETGGKCRR